MNPEVDWDFARNVAGRIAGREPFADSYHQESMESDFIELTAQAEELVAAETGLQSDTLARGRVTDRMGWVDANLASFDRLLRPLLGKMEEQAEAAENGNGESSGEGGQSRFADSALGKALGPLTDVMAPVGSAVGDVFGQVGDVVGPKMAGAEAGALLGWMSSQIGRAHV